MKTSSSCREGSKANAAERNARGNGQVTTGQSSKQRHQFTALPAKYNPRFGDVTAGDMVPLVMADLARRLEERGAP